ncbi:MAG: hypothetical protein HW394_1990, partial [Acidobacteria bacterium]|nr:hypothetical protein [Acidobacteriota bacterium]
MVSKPWDQYKATAAFEHDRAAESIRGGGHGWQGRGNGDVTRRNCCSGFSLRNDSHTPRA